MIVKDITDVVESFAPLSIQEKWDNSGLVIGSASSEVHGVLLGFDCTPDLVDEAVACGADLIITHHPLIFGGIKKITSDDIAGSAIIKAIRAGIAVYAAHTTADKVLEGVSGAMASRLGLVNVNVLDADCCGNGLGAVGDLPLPMTSDDAVDYVKSKFGLKTVRRSHLIDVPVTKIAMCGGSGASLIDAARRAGAQMYVSGDISYHHFFTGDDFIIMDIGHFESEVDIVDILFSMITKKFPNFAVRISSRLRESNPVFYC